MDKREEIAKYIEDYLRGDFNLFVDRAPVWEAAREIVQGKEK